MTLVSQTEFSFQENFDGSALNMEDLQAGGAIFMIEPSKGDPEHHFGSKMKTIHLNSSDEESTKGVVFYRKPKLRQRIMNGILIREGEEHKASWMELFYDLAFVGSVARVAATLRSSLTPFNYFIYCLNYATIFRLWLEVQLYLNRFDSQDFVHRLFMFATMGLVVGVGINSGDPLDLGKTGLVVCSLLATLAVILMYFNAARYNPSARPFIVYVTSYNLLFMLFQFSTLFFDDHAITSIIWFSGLLVSYFLAPIGTHWDKINIPLNPEHNWERLGIYMIVVLGEMIIAVLFELPDGESPGLISYTMTASGLAIASCIFLLYYDLQEVRGIHAMNKSTIRSQFWVYAHLPFSLSIIMLGSGLELIVVSSLPADHSAHHGDPEEALVLFGWASGTVWLSLAIMYYSHGDDHQSKHSLGVRATSIVILGIISIFLPSLTSFGVDVSYIPMLSSLLCLIFCFYHWHFSKIVPGLEESQHRMHRMLSMPTIRADNLQSPSDSDHGHTHYHSPRGARRIPPVKKVDRNVLTLSSLQDPATRRLISHKIKDDHHPVISILNHPQSLEELLALDDPISPSVELNLISTTASLDDLSLPQPPIDLSSVTEGLDQSAMDQDPLPPSVDISLPTS